ncbi:MAG: carboxypeptidase-like regulatory domain-containing protein [Planctomycetota bacterium]
MHDLWGRLPIFREPRPYDSVVFHRLGRETLARIQDDRRFVSAERLAELRAAGHYPRLPNAVSGPDGTFVITVPAGARELKQLTGPGLASRRWSMEVASAGRCARQVGVQRNLPVASGEVDVGDVTLHLGARVQGCLQDQDGLPIEDASVTLDGVPAAIVEGTVPFLFDDPEWGQQPVIDARTLADGVFAFDSPIPPGRYRLTVRAPGVGAPTPEFVVVGRAGVTVGVVAQRVPPLEFRLTDEAGHPLPGREVQAFSADHKDCGKTITDDWGRAHLLATRFSDREPLPIAHLWVTDGSRDLIDASDLAWDAVPRTLVARAAPPLRLVVLPADGSTPEQAQLHVSASLKLLEPGAGAPPCWSKHSSGWAARLFISSVPHGLYSLHVQSLQGWGWGTLSTALDLRRGQPREIVLHLPREAPPPGASRSPR